MAYSNSSLASVTILSPNKSSRNGTKIDTITIHCMAGPLTADTCGQWFSHTTTKASSNYGIGPDGKIGLYVEEKDRSWASSNQANDMRAVTIEVASDSEHPYKVTDAAYKSLIILCTDICARNGIKALKWRGDRSLIGQISKQNMTVHRWFSNKACPGDYLYNKHSDIVKQVNTKLGTYVPGQADVITDSGSTTVDTSDLTATSMGYNPATMTNSDLVTYKAKTVAEMGTARTSLISCITIHSARAQGDVKKIGKMINSSKVCYNYGIDSDGVIALYVEEASASNGTGNKYNDNRTVNIVCANSTLDPNYEISEDCYESLVNLCEDICRRNYIFKLQYYKKEPKRSTLTLHSQFKDSNCPGPYLSKKCKELINEVNERLASNSSSWVSVTKRMAYTQTGALKVQSTISLGSIKPYVLKPSTKVLGINYNQLREIGVVGVMIDAGARFDKNHNELKSYRNANTYKQTEEAKAANMLHGYYYTTRAKSLEDVKLECKGLYYIISNYPPKLGIWLRLDLDVDSKTAVGIVEKYYATFVEWGLKSKCGLCATIDQAKLINWPKQSNYMPIWWEGELEPSVAPSDEVLTPSFFQLPGISQGEFSGKNIGYGSALADSVKGEYEGLADESEETDEYTGGDKEVGQGFTNVILPIDPDYTGWKAWESYTAFTSKNTRQYKLTRSKQCKVDSDGFLRVDGRYLIAVGSNVCNTVGTYMDVYLENGTVIETIMGDMKADVHTDKTNTYTIVNKNHCCTEFIVNKNKLVSSVKSSGNCSKLKKSWNSPVVSIKVYTKNWFAAGETQ